MGMGKNSSLCMDVICGFRKWLILPLVESLIALIFLDTTKHFFYIKNIFIIKMKSKLDLNEICIFTLNSLIIKNNIRLE